MRRLVNPSDDLCLACGDGLVIADAAAKSAVIDPVGYASPSQGTSFSNEVIFTFSGDSGAVRQAVIAAREVGLQLLSTLIRWKLNPPRRHISQASDDDARGAVGR